MYRHQSYASTYLKQCADKGLTPYQGILVRLNLDDKIALDLLAKLPPEKSTSGVLTHTLAA